MRFTEGTTEMYFVGKADDQLIQERLTREGKIELNIVNNFWVATSYPTFNIADNKADQFIIDKKINPPLTIYKLNQDDILKPEATTIDILLDKEENLTEKNELKRMKKFADKRQKGLGAFVKLDAGNVEKGMEFFNNAMGGISEALEISFNVIYENPNNTKINGVEFFDSLEDAKSFIETLPKDYYKEILKISVDEETGEAHEETLYENYSKLTEDNHFEDKFLNEIVRYLFNEYYDDSEKLFKAFLNKIKKAVKDNYPEFDDIGEQDKIISEAINKRFFKLTEEK